MFNTALYIDPATTSYIVQIAAAVVVALGVSLGIFWNKLKRLFKKKDAKDEMQVTKKKKDGENKDIVVTADDLLDD